MKLLALDPGSSQSAYCVYDTEKKKPITFGTLPNEKVLEPPYIFGMAHMLVIEKVSCMGMAVGETVFDTVFWSGRFIQKLIDLKIEWAEEAIWDRIERKDVKMHLCGSMRAKDANIRQALIDKFGEPGTKKAPGLLYKMNNDERAALAVAITYAETRMNTR